MISIFDYGAGNLRSVQNTLGAIGAEYELIRDAAGIRKATKLILPGVGHYGQMMREVDELGVRGALVEEGLSPGALCLELTESLLMNNASAAADLLETLRALDVKLSIDDFGPGYSSLSYLRRFRVDNVKIDRSFVDGLDDDDSSDETLVAAILAMAKALQVATVAEGVETLTQAERLHALGCQTAQGYYFSRPVPADQIPSVADRLGVVRGLNLVRDSEIA